MYNCVISVAGKWSVYDRCRGCWPKVVGCPINAVHTSYWPGHRISPVDTASFANSRDICQATSSSRGRRPSANSIFTTVQTFESVESELLAASLNKLKINIISYTRVFKNVIVGNSLSFKGWGRQHSGLLSVVPEFVTKYLGRSRGTSVTVSWGWVTLRTLHPSKSSGHN